MLPRDEFLAMTPAQRIIRIDRWLSDPDWCKDKPLRKRVEQVRARLVYNTLKYPVPAPFTLWVVNVYLVGMPNISWGRGSEHILDPRYIHNYSVN